MAPRNNYIRAFGNLRRPWHPEKPPGRLARTFTSFRSEETQQILRLINSFTQAYGINNKYKQTARNIGKRLAAGGSRSNAVTGLHKIASNMHADTIREWEEEREQRKVANLNRQITAAQSKGNITQNQASNLKEKIRKITFMNPNKAKIYEEAERAIKLGPFRRLINQADIAPNRKNKLRQLLNNPNKSSHHVNIAVRHEIGLVRNYKTEIAKLNGHILRLQKVNNAPNKENKIKQIRELRNALTEQLYKTNVFTPEYRRSVSMRRNMGNYIFNYARNRK